MPEGRELTSFAQWWLDGAAPSTTFAGQLTLGSYAGAEVAQPAKKGVSLSSLLAEVS